MCDKRCGGALNASTLRITLESDVQANCALDTPYRGRYIPLYTVNIMGISFSEADNHTRMHMMYDSRQLTCVCQEDCGHRPLELLVRSH